MNGGFTICNLVLELVKSVATFCSKKALFSKTFKIYSLVYFFDTLKYLLFFSDFMCLRTFPSFDCKKRTFPFYLPRSLLHKVSAPST